MSRPVIVSVGEVLWDNFPKESFLGGAPANVAIHAAALGAESWLVSAVGNDPRGNMAFDRLDAAGVQRQTVTRIANKKTGSVQIALSAKGVPNYDVTEDVAWDHMPWSSTIDGVVKRAEAISFGSLAQRTKLSKDTVRHAVGAAPPRSWRLFDVNLRQRYYDSEILKTSLTLANAVKLNDRELPVVQRLCGLGEGTQTDLLLALCEKFALRLAVLTKGAKGAMLRTLTTTVDVAAPAVQVVDPVGAGDAFTAALLIGLLHGQSLDEIGTRANAVAAYVCTQAGATPALPAHLK